MYSFPWYTAYLNAVHYEKLVSDVRRTMDSGDDSPEALYPSHGGSISLHLEGYTRACEVTEPTVASTGASGSSSNFSTISVLPKTVAKWRGVR